MFITKKHISRRMILRGMSFAAALPLHDSIIPAQTPLAQAAATPNWHVTAMLAESCGPTSSSFGRTAGPIFTNALRTASAVKASDDG